MPAFGPFSVDPAQITALGGANFGQFVNSLLNTEVMVNKMAGETLETTYMENIGDGGVDAMLRNASQTRWIPAGNSVWQFKAGDRNPKTCKTEIIGSTYALETLRTGGSYRLVFGSTLTALKIKNRRQALEEAMAESGIDIADGAIEIITADGLAFWTEQYPALSISPLLRGTSTLGLTFNEWSLSVRHTTTWVSSSERDSQIIELRKNLANINQVDTRIEGESGIGKTRLVLEALRGQPYETIVVYSLAADSFSVGLLSQMQLQGRTAIIVIDECDRKHHEIYASALSTNSSIRLITIGESDDDSTRTPRLTLTPFNDDAMEELLYVNQRQIWPEAMRVVVEVAAGNIEYALKLSQVLLSTGSSSAGTLITKDDLKSRFITQLPDGKYLSACCVLALFSRFGYDGEAAHELESIASGLGLFVEDLRVAAGMLQQKGFLAKQGRFRSVGPHPLAVYLATQGWSEFGPKIVVDMLPSITPDLTERLFRRATDIGELDILNPAISAISSPLGPLASLEMLGKKNNSKLLIHFAVLAPENVADQLAVLIADASDNELQQYTRIRRDLVWALEKLAWHSKTFTDAADSLLRLALNEIEDFSNNATGTWTNFFSTMLPNTSASPRARVLYLHQTATSHDSRVRLLAARGAVEALKQDLSVMVSGEVQGGLIVEPRGAPNTHIDMCEYMCAAIDVLSALTSDPDPQVAKEARTHIVTSLHSVLQIPKIREHLGHVIAELSTNVISLARIEIESLRLLFKNANVDDDRPNALAEFLSLLPVESLSERLTVLCNTKAWDRDVDELTSEIAGVARQVNADNPATVLIQILDSNIEISAAYAIGQALQRISDDYCAIIDRLDPLVGTRNVEVLIGYLDALVRIGESDAYDRYIANSSLPPLLTLQLSVQGPQSPASHDRTNILLATVTVAEAAHILLYWMRDENQIDAAKFIQECELRIASQEDYNATVSFAAMQARKKNGFLESLAPTIARIVARRIEFPELGTDEWSWDILARCQLACNPVALSNLLADLIESHKLFMHAHSKKLNLLQETVKVGGVMVWVNLMERLEQDGRRLMPSVHDWLGDSVSIDIVKHWVGDNVERARILASVTKPNGKKLSPATCLLLDYFGKDTQVLKLISRFDYEYSGKESEYFARQILQTRGWIDEPGQSPAVKLWARKRMNDLETRRRELLEEEEEQDW